jgi:hypothetical protein
LVIQRNVNVRIDNVEEAFDDTRRSIEPALQSWAFGLRCEKFIAHPTAWRVGEWFQGMSWFVGVNYQQEPYQQRAAWFPFY